MSLLFSLVSLPIQAEGSTEMNSTNWMNYISDDTSLKDITIPGTHDTCSKGIISAYLPWAQTQDMSITEQLYNGIRLLDFRLKTTKPIVGQSELALYHGASAFECDCHITYAEAISEVAQFLVDHPTETVLISLKYEGSGDIPDKFRQQMSTILGVYESFKDDPSAPVGVYLDSAIPTLGQVRGKVVFLNRMYDDIQFGIDYNNAATIEDHYDLFTEEKEGYIETALYNIENGTNPTDKAVITFTSTNPITRLYETVEWYDYVLSTVSLKVGSQMYLARIVYTSDHINEWLMNRSLDKAKCYGWFFMDYPSSGLIKKIYDVNFQ